MKTLFFISASFLNLLMAALLLAVPTNAQTRPDKIRVVMENNYPPFVFLDSSGKPQGTQIDLWRLWEQKTGIKTEISLMDWDDAQLRLQTGEFDVIDKIAKTGQRTKLYDFSEPFSTIEVPVFFLKDIAGITGTDSLKGFAVGVQSGDSAIERLHSQGVDNLLYFNNYEEIVTAAKERKVNVMVMDKAPALFFLNKYGILRDFKQSAPLDVVSLHRAVKKGNSALLATVEDGFRRITPDELKAIETKWYGTTLGNSFPATSLLAGAGGLILLVLILFAWNRTLKISVDKRTSELKCTEEILRKSEEKFRAFFDQGYCFAGLMDLDGTLTDVNSTALQFSGAKKEDVIGKPFWETPWWVHSPELQEKLRKAVSTAAEGTLVRFEATHPSTDGTLHYVDFSLRPVKDHSGATIFLVPEGRDITDRKQAEEALEESWERYRGLSEAGFETIFFSERGICTEQNRNAELTFGYSDSEAIGRPGTEWIVPEDRDLVMRNMASGYEEPYEVTALRKNGTTFPALIRAKMMYYRGRDVRVTSLSNISDHKKAEEDRLNLERQLLHSQKLESLGILSGGIAHDFNNLLQALLGNLDIALMRLPQDTPARNNIDQAIKAAGHAAQLTNMMLAYSGKGIFIIKPLNLTAIMEENVTLLEAAIPKSITLEQRLDSALPTIRADAGQLQQVIMNLITNAAEAIGDHGGKIKLSTGVKEFTQDILNNSRLAEKQAAGRYVWMEVRDSGCGMNDETLLKLFDPFFTTKFTGRGLGMSAVLGIIRAHKGAFLAESRPGVGTTIQVLFPIADNQPTGDGQVIEREIVTTQETGHSVKVLVVDDEDMIRAVTTAMLEELGYETLAAASGEEALELFRQEGGSIDVVLLDQVMPDMDGVTVFKELRRIQQDVKVLLASGFSQQEVSERFLGLGLNGFLQKPYTLKNLTTELSRVIEGEDR